MNKNILRTLLIITSGLGVVLSSPLMSTEMEEIVVTGLKREASVMTTPSAISALSAEQLAAKGIDDISQLQYAVPSLHFGSDLGGKNVTIRGIGEFNFAPGVMVTLDGLVQPNATSAGLTQLDLGRVEVLRGPQGTLYGRNASGGAVNFVAAKPTDQFFGKVQVGYADFDQTNGEIVLSGPVSENVGLRLAASHLDAGEGWIENLSPGYDDLMKGEKTNIRLLVTADFSESFSAELLLGRSEVKGSWEHQAIIHEHVSVGAGTGLPTDAPWGWGITEEPLKTYNRGPSITDREYESIALTMKWDFDSFSVKSITGHQDWYNFFHIAADGTNIGMFDRPDYYENKTLTQEINISGKTNKLDWIFGAYYMDDEATRDFTVQFPVAAGPPAFPPFPMRIHQPMHFEDTEAKAIFLDMTYALSERVRVGAGVRKTEEDKVMGHDFFIYARFPTGDMLLVDRCGPGITVREIDESDTTIRASVEYDVSDSSMMYASYSEGFKVGGINSSDCDPGWKPETVDAFEIGYKASIFDGATSLRAAIFDYDYSDFQVAQVIGIQGIIANAGDAKIQGIELELDSSISENFSVNAGITLMETEYGDFLNTDSLFVELGAQQLSGNKLNNAPETSFNVGATYKAMLENGGSLSFNISTSYRSRVYFREFNSEKDSQPSYAVTNVNINWRSADEGYSARLYANNVTDEEYVVGMVTGNTQYGRMGMWGMPRQVGVEFTKFFGSK